MTTPELHVAAQADDDPLADLPQSPLDPDPATEEELRRRMHLAPFVLDLLDPAVSTEQRDNALRHLLICDPARGLGAVAFLATKATVAVEQVYGDPPGRAIQILREALAEQSAHLADLAADR